MRHRLGQGMPRMCRRAGSGLYVALRHWCPPGGRVLMSPVNDDVIFFVVLAAGLRPVQAPFDAHDGSIDLAAVPGSHSARAVRRPHHQSVREPRPGARTGARCDTLGIPLIEDAAHAIGSEIAGRPVGTFGHASVFSLSKHVGAKTGGFLAIADPGLRAALAKTRDELLEPPARRPNSPTRYVRTRRPAYVGCDWRRAAWAALRHARSGGTRGDQDAAPGRRAEAGAGHGAGARGVPSLGPGRPARLPDPARAGPGSTYATAPRRAGRVGSRPIDAVLNGWPLPGGAGRQLPGPGLGGRRRGARARPAALPGAAARRGPGRGHRAALARDRGSPRAISTTRRSTTTRATPSPTRRPHPGPAAWFARHALPVDPRLAGRAIDVLARRAPGPRRRKAPAAVADTVRPRGSRDRRTRPRAGWPWAAPGRSRTRPPAHAADGDSMFRNAYALMLSTASRPPSASASGWSPRATTARRRSGRARPPSPR